MGQYSLIIEKSAKVELKDLYKSGDKISIKKVEQIFLELSLHPETGTGNPERLKYNLNGY
jgi:toxin YoeB